MIYKLHDVSLAVESKDGNDYIIVYDIAGEEVYRRMIENDGFLDLLEHAKGDTQES